MKDNFEKIMDLGKVGITIASHDNGLWNKDHTYERLTLVMHQNGNTYVSKKSVVGVDPADDVDKNKTYEYWFKMTEHGHNVYEMLVAAGKYTGTEAEWIVDSVETQRKVDEVTTTVAGHTTQIADLDSRLRDIESKIDILLNQMSS